MAHPSRSGNLAPLGRDQSCYLHQSSATNGATWGPRPDFATGQERVTRAERESGPAGDSAAAGGTGLFHRALRDTGGVEELLQACEIVQGDVLHVEDVLIVLVV